VSSPFGKDELASVNEQWRLGESVVEAKIITTASQRATRKTQ
jgi:hypothetical protein